MNQTLTIRIPKELKKELEEISKIEQKPISDMVRDTLLINIAIQRFSNLRKMVIPFA